MGKYNEQNCESCGNKHISTLQEVVQAVLCKECGVETGTRTRKLSTGKEASPYRSGNLCDDCRAKTPVKKAESKRGELNPNWKGGPSNYKRKPTGLSKEELRDRASERMKNNNPMKSPQVVRAACEARSARVASGDLIYRAGPNHHRWKGNRNRAQAIRTRLYRKWILPILERDDFTCQGCGASNCRLEVHHTEDKFRDILAEALEGRAINELSEDAFEEVIQRVVNLHVNKGIKGITYCKKCHKAYDPLRR